MFAVVVATYNMGSVGAAQVCTDAGTGPRPCCASSTAGRGRTNHRRAAQEGEVIGLGEAYSRRELRRTNSTASSATSLVG